MSYASAIDKARVGVGAKASKFMPDRMTIFSSGTEARDAYGEVTTAESQIESGVPCSYEALNAYERAAGGSVTASATHKLKMPYGANTAQIGASYRLVIAARGNTSEMVFDVTGRLDGSAKLLLEVAAILRS